MFSPVPPPRTTRMLPPVHYDGSRVFIHGMWVRFRGTAALPLRALGTFDVRPYGGIQYTWILDNDGTLWGRETGDLRPEDPVEVREWAAHSPTEGAAETLDDALGREPWWAERARAAGWRPPTVEPPDVPIKRISAHETPGMLADADLRDVTLWFADLVERIEMLGPRFEMVRDDVARRYERLRTQCVHLRHAPAVHGSPQNLFAQMGDGMWAALTRIRT